MAREKSHFKRCMGSVVMGEVTLPKYQAFLRKRVGIGRNHRERLGASPSYPVTRNQPDELRGKVSKETVVLYQCIKIL